MAVKFLFKTAVAAAVVAGAYAAAGYWGVPQGVRWGLETYLKPALGAKSVTVESVTFDPWNWTLEVRGVSALSAKNKSLLSLRRFYTDVSGESVTKLAPVVSALYVEGLKASITTGSKKVESAKKEASQTSASDSLTLPAFSIADIRVTDSAVTLTNSKAGVSCAVTDVNLTLPLVSTLAAGTLAPVTPALSLKIDGRPVKASGTADIKSAALKISATDIDAAKLVRAADLALPVRIDKLSVSADTDITFKMAGSTPQVTAKGTVAAKSVDVRDEAGRNFVKLASASVTVGHFDLAKQSVSVTNAEVHSPDITLRLSPAKNSGTKNAPVEKSPETSSAWQWSLAKASLTSGTVTVIDQSVKPTAQLRIAQIKASAQGLSSQKNKTGTVSLSARLGSGTVSASGHLGVSPLKADLTTKIAALNLAQFNGWVKPLAGAQLTSGTAQLAGNLSYKDAKTPQIAWRGDFSLVSLAAKNAAGKTLMTWKKASANGVDLKSVTPVNLTVGELVVEQPAQKVTKTVSTIADILGAVAAATGHENTARRAGKVSQTVQKDIRVKNLVYADGRFSVNGIGRGTLEALAVETLNSIFAKAGK
ncbi:DUF748 domain-containing protein [Duodenibacillus massiliensis]|uniref:DUF748 domain-containing protein n=1 Tax=Duodenibacillus massiliensis TaxID=1852381 RepID=UPI0003403059|nr:DUF748 domain-containing protein [uncultured Duodenibacillus sp.]CDD72003.1 putative uncharacterized protein [Sutterella sp. CAG:397]